MELGFALASFVLVATITPGPNNMMLLSSGATFGLRRTIPHLLGIAGGCAAMVMLLGWALAGIIDRLPGLYAVLHVVSAVYLLWLAWRIATSTGPHDGGANRQPLSALQAAAFQWVNPKAWALVMGAVISFSRPGHIASDVPLIALVLTLVALPCFTLWASAGSLLSRFLHDPRVLRAFNIAMATLLVASIVPSFWPQGARP